MRKTHTGRKLRGILAAIRKHDQFPTARILGAHLAEQSIRENLGQFLETGALSPDGRAYAAPRPVGIAARATGRISPRCAWRKRGRRRIDDISSWPVHPPHAV